MTTTTIDRLNSICGSTTDPADALSVRASDEAGYRYEVYASGYGEPAHFRTARAAEQYIRQHYAALVEQGRN